MKNYSASINPDLVSFIPNNSVVLDAGCADGRFGEFLKKNKNCTVLGIEKNKASAKKARKALDKIFCIDIEKTKPKIANQTIDVIVFSDVLEHLREPEKILKNYRTLLKPNGKIVVSIPNIANFLVRKELLFGNFDYRDKGILDENHLRFFTLKTVQKMFSDSGFKILKIKATQNILYNKLCRKALEFTRLMGAYDKINYFLANKWKTLFAKQFVILAEKAD